MNDRPVSRRALLATFPVVAVAASTSCARQAEQSPSTASPTVRARTLDATSPHLDFAAAAGLAPDGGGAKRVEVLVDFLCPHCRDFSLVNAEDLRSLSEAGEVRLAVAVRPMLDRKSMTTYSLDTAAAYAALFTQDPALVWALERALFEAQPSFADVKAAGGIPAGDLAALLRDAGASEATIASAADGPFKDWLTSTVEPHYRDMGLGTPVVLVDGEELDGDWTAPGELRKALVA